MMAATDRAMTGAERGEVRRLVARIRGEVMTAEAALALVALERRTRQRRALEQALGGRGGAPIGAPQFVVHRHGELVALTLAACTDAELEALGRRFRRASLEAIARIDRLSALAAAEA